MAPIHDLPVPVRQGCGHSWVLCSASHKAVIQLLGWDLVWAQDPLPSSCACRQASFPCTCKAHCGLLLQGQQERASLTSRCSLKGLTWLGQANPGESPFWLLKVSWLGKLITFTKSLHLCLFCCLEARHRFFPVKEGGGHTKVWLPGGRSHGGHLRNLPTTGRKFST